MLKITPGSQNKKILLSITQNVNHVRTGIRKGLFYAGKNLRQIAKEKILDKASKTGRIYRIRRGKSVKNHQASAPGQYPASLSGALQKSLDFTVVGSNRMYVGARVPYAHFLEEGTAKMAERPYLVRTARDESSKTLGFLKQEIKKELARRP